MEYFFVASVTSSDVFRAAGRNFPSRGADFQNSDHVEFPLNPMKSQLCITCTKMVHIIDMAMFHFFHGQKEIGHEPLIIETLALQPDKWGNIGEHKSKHVKHVISIPFKTYKKYYFLGMGIRLSSYYMERTRESRVLTHSSE